MWFFFVSERLAQFLAQDLVDRTGRYCSQYLDHDQTLEVGDCRCCRGRAGGLGLGVLGKGKVTLSVSGRREESKSVIVVDFLKHTFSLYILGSYMRVSTYWYRCRIVSQSCINLSQCSCELRTCMHILKR